MEIVSGRMILYFLEITSGCSVHCTDECERENDIFIPMCVKIIGMIYLLLKSRNMKLFIRTPRPRPIFVTSICLLMSIAFSVFGALRGRWSNIREAELQP